MIEIVQIGTADTARIDPYFNFAATKWRNIAIFDAQIARAVYDDGLHRVPIPRNVRAGAGNSRSSNGDTWHDA
jgi:hypothetical protein